MFSLLLTSSGGASWDNGYFQQAWDNFWALIQWMRSTTILTLGGTEWTFWNIGVGVLMITMLIEFINMIFWGD